MRSIHDQHIKLIADIDALPHYTDVEMKQYSTNITTIQALNSPVRLRFSITDPGLGTTFALLACVGLINVGR